MIFDDARSHRSTIWLMIIDQLVDTKVKPPGVKLDMSALPIATAPAPPFPFITPFSF